MFKIRDSVPSRRYSPVCNVLHQWKTSLIPTYRVGRLYDICWVQSMDLHNPWIALCKSWIRTLRGQSMDCGLIVYAHISIAHTIYVYSVRLECDAYSVHVHGLYKPAS